MEGLAFVYYGSIVNSRPKNDKIATMVYSVLLYGYLLDNCIPFVIYEIGIQNDHA